MRFKLPDNQNANRVLAGLACLALLGTVAAGLAQTVKDISIEEMVNQAQARADALRAQLGDITGPTTQKVEAYKQDAATLAAGNRERIRTGLSYLGQGYTQDTLDEKDDTSPNGVVYVAVSLSMPTESLRQLSRDANKAHVQLVIQGLINGSFKQTFAKMKTVFNQGDLGGIAIDPRVFEQYQIKEVPAFIAAPQAVQNCEQGLDCDRGEVPHDILRGNVTLGYALKQIADRGDAAPLAAKEALERLEN